MAHPARLPVADPHLWLDLLRWATAPIDVLRAVVDAAPRACAEESAVFAVVAEDDDPDSETKTHVFRAAQETARVVCGDCPVRGACAALAMSRITETVDGGPSTVRYAPFGVYGGLTGVEREALAGVLPAGPVAGPVAVGTVRPMSGCPMCGVHPDGKAVYCSAECRLRADAERQAARREQRRAQHPLVADERPCRRAGCTAVLAPVVAGTPGLPPVYCSARCQQADANTRAAARRAERWAGLVCARPGCETQVPPQQAGGNRRYCSAECRKTTTNDRRRDDRRRKARETERAAA